MVNMDLQKTDAATGTDTPPPSNGAKPKGGSSSQGKFNLWQNKPLWLIIGFVLAMAAGIISGLVWGWDIFVPKSADLTFTLLLGFVIFGLVGVGAFLIRSRWAFLIVPAGWLVGEILVAAWPSFQRTWESFQAALGTWHFQWSLSFLILICSLIIGTVIGLVFEQRSKKQQQ